MTSNTQVNQLTLGRFKETADAVRGGIGGHRLAYSVNSTNGACGG